MSKWIKNTGTKPNTQGKPFEVRCRDGVTLQASEESEVNWGNGFDWSLDDVSGDIVEWRFTGTVKASGLTQAEVQSLLNIVRGELSTTTFIKDLYVGAAASLWGGCDKANPSTEFEFENYSYNRKRAIINKQKEKKLVALIAKLKGLR